MEVEIAYRGIVDYTGALIWELEEVEINIGAGNRPRHPIVNEEEVDTPYPTIFSPPSIHH